MTTTDIKLKLNHRYNFPEQSTVDVQILETLDNYVMFFENEFVWQGNYRAL